MTYALDLAHDAPPRAGPRLAYSADARQVAEDLRRDLDAGVPADRDVLRPAVWMLDRLTPFDEGADVIEELWHRTGCPRAS